MFHKRDILGSARSKPASQASPVTPEWYLLYSENIGWTLSPARCCRDAIGVRHRVTPDSLLAASRLEDATEAPTCAEFPDPKH